MGLVVTPLSPTPAPLELCERLADLPNLLFLDSAALGPTGRFTYLTADPVRVFRSRVPGDALEEARAAMRELASPRIEGLPPFQGGLAGFVGYDFGRVLERLPPPRADDLDVPDVWLGLYDWVIAWDHGSDQAWVVSTGLPERGAAAARRAEMRARDVIARLEGVPPAPHDRPGPAREISTPPVSNFSRAGYLSAVARVREYILAGDVFQVNIAQRFEAPLTVSPLALYRRLRSRNPAPYAAFIDGGSFQIASASPERFLRLDGDLVDTRPIKGTRPRDPDPARDAALARELAASAKDRAENVMIVDLLRNDLSRVCRPGSVEVPSLLSLETLPTVHHLVSTVTGRLEAGRDAFDLLRAAFPGGSITGAPKVRAMEIITELEPVRRSAYCGSIGYISRTGDMDTSIVIRTYVAAGGKVYFSAGGGVVADSDPAAEYDESLHKARALVEALQ
ncbi:MAG TPA: aminodeoxychorismate synthase component I [Gemmatimonadales bacterium]|nr:aminodeoxychorismate synthase component I [Gemmatimonadales bacterium]